MEIISLLLALFRAIPILDKWFQTLMVEWFNRSVDKMQTENLAAIKKALSDYDQRELEKAIGNPNAGEPSGNPGSTIVDELPGVQRDP
jgi:hypothetical protein